MAEMAAGPGGGGAYRRGDSILPQGRSSSGLGLQRGPPPRGCAVWGPGRGLVLRRRCEGERGQGVLTGQAVSGEGEVGDRLLGADGRDVWVGVLVRRRLEPIQGC